MENVLVAIGAAGVMISIYAKYAYARSRIRSREDAIGLPSTASTVGLTPHYVPINRARGASIPPRWRRRGGPMREND